MKQRIALKLNHTLHATFRLDMNLTK